MGMYADMSFIGMESAKFSGMLSEVAYELGYYVGDSIFILTRENAMPILVRMRENFLNIGDSDRYTAWERSCRPEVVAEPLRNYQDILRFESDVKIMAAIVHWLAFPEMKDAPDEIVFV